MITHHHSVCYTAWRQHEESLRGHCHRTRESVQGLKIVTMRRQVIRRVDSCLERLPPLGAFGRIFHKVTAPPPPRLVKVVVKMG